MFVHWLKLKKHLIASILVDAFILYLVYNLTPSQQVGPSITLEFFIIIFLWILISYIRGRYSKSYSLPKKTTLSDIYNILIVVFIHYFIFNIFSLNITLEKLINLKISVYFYSCSAVISLICQYLLNRFSIRSFKSTKKVLFAGSMTCFEKHLQYIEESTLIKKPELIKYSGEGINFRNIKELLIEDNICIDHQIDNIISAKISKGLEILKPLNWCEINLHRIPSDIIGNNELLEYDWFPETNSIQQRIKRIGDIILSFTLIIITLPIVIFASLLIKLEDKGPIFYTQSRTGIWGSELTIIKLRTMNKDAEKDGARWSEKNDKRVTEVGKVLRKLRIDELPQLWLVFTGEMSLIGPRPERPEINKILSEEIKNYNLRHCMRPGLSGWAQVNFPYGASIKDSEMKLSYDLFYLRNFSFWLDMLIFFKTLRLIFNASGSVPIG